MKVVFLMSVAIILYHFSNASLKKNEQLNTMFATAKHDIFHIQLIFRFLNKFLFTHQSSCVIDKWAFTLQRIIHL